MQKFPTSVTKAFTLANELLGCVDAYSSTAERATRLDRGEELAVGHENMAVEWDGNRQVLADALVKKTRESYALESKKVRDLLKARK